MTVKHFWLFHLLWLMRFASGDVTVPLACDESNYPPHIFIQRLISDGYMFPHWDLQTPTGGTEHREREREDSFVLIYTSFPIEFCCIQFKEVESVKRTSESLVWRVNHQCFRWLAAWWRRLWLFLPATSIIWRSPPVRREAATRLRRTSWSSVSVVQISKQIYKHS